MNFSNPKYQVYALITISVVISLSFNLIRSNPINMIAQDLKKIDNIENDSKQNYIFMYFEAINEYINWKAWHRWP